MGFILGFGSEETEVAKRIIQECLDAIKASEDNPQTVVDRIAAQYNEASHRNDKLARAEAPERYTMFWPSYHHIHGAKDIVEFSMLHVHRRHALSTDGWASLSTKWILVIEDDGHRIFGQV